MLSTLPTTAIPQFVTISELVTAMKISRQTISRKINSGEIPHKRLGSRVLIPVEFLTDFKSAAFAAVKEGGSYG